MFKDYNDFIVINFFENNKSLLINWLPGNQSMSRLEYWRAIELIINTVTVSSPYKILIDAYDYDYPVVSEEMIRFIRLALTKNTMIIKLGLVKSNLIYGQFAIRYILKKFEGMDLNITLFNTSTEGLDWFLS